MTVRPTVAPIARPALFESLDRRVLLAAAGDIVAPLVASSAMHAPLEAGDYKELGINLGATNYYAPFWAFADALKMESRGWMFTGGFSSIPTSYLDATGNPIAAGTYHAQPFQNNSHPLRAPRGIYVVTWEGDGDVTLGNTGNASNPSVTFLSGSAAEKRRVYRLNYGHVVVNLQNNVTGEGHVQNVHVWMPDPSDAGNKSLEPAAGAPLPVWHPDYVNHLREVAADTGFLRFMDQTHTNGSPQVNWADRRPVEHAFASGNTNYKLLNVPGDPSTTRFGNIGIPWEYVIELCNELNVGAWINVPHAANNDYVENLAKLFAGELPSSPGLKPGLKLYLEHSNEIWSSGSGFVQGDWAAQEGAKIGLTKAQFNAKRAVEIFRIFDQVYSALDAVNGTDRANDVVRVAGAFTGQTWYTQPYLQKMQEMAGSYGDGKTYNADVLAVTTYFGGSSLIRYAFNEANWLGVNLNNPDDAVINQIFDYWANDLTLNAQGTGIEGDAGSGGFGTAMGALAEQYGLKLVSYEGGTSLYTETVTTYVKDGKIVNQGTPGAVGYYSLANYINDNFPDDDGIAGNTDRFTKLLMALNRHPRIAEVYAGVLQTAKAQGLKTHAIYSDIGSWSKYGQWGHKEYLGQPSSYAYGDAVKWQFIKDFIEEEGDIRDIDDVLGTAPVLPGNRSLGSVFVGDNFTRDLIATPGDGAGEQIRYEIVAGKLPPGMTLTKISDTTIRVQGAASTAGTYRFMVRALDADNDASYAVYAITAQPIAGTSTVYNATHDTFANQSETGTGVNGTNDYIYAGTGRRTGYTKFSVNSGIVGKIDRVVLRLYVRNYEGAKAPTGGELWIEEAPNTLKDGATAWTESNLTNSTAPLTSKIIGSKKILGADPGGFYEFDVTEYVKAQAEANNGVVSIAIRGVVQNGSNGFVAVRLASKEFAGGVYAPKLVVTQSPTNAAVPPQGSIQPVLPNPRTGSIETATVVFNKAVTGVDIGDFALSRDGTTINLSGVTVSTTNNITYTLNGLAAVTRTAGTYMLTLNRDGSEIRDSAGTLLGDGDSEGWLAYAGVIGRHVFYNNSAFDTGVGLSDDTAIAPDKTALLPGGKGAFVNYTSYSKGINGIMVDISGLPVSSLAASDFTFKTGNTSTPSSWATLNVAPTITVRKGAGVNGSDRVTIIWPDNTIRKTWLQVTVKNTTATSLLNADTFYFGNAVGEIGNMAANAQVNVIDLAGVRDNFRNADNPAPIDFTYDMDRNARVNVLDMAYVRDNLTNSSTALQLIQV